MAQAPPEGTTPPFIPWGEPTVLDKSEAILGELVQQRKWRRRYNAYELAVLVWQIYHKARESENWQDAFKSITGLMEEENGMHENHLAGKRRSTGLDQSYDLVYAIHLSFSDIVRRFRDIQVQIKNSDSWPDAQNRQKVLHIASSILSRAIGAVRYLPSIGGVDLKGPGWEGLGFQEVEADAYWATPMDRIAHLERMHRELQGIQNDVRSLQGLLQRIQVGRRDARAQKQMGELLFIDK